MTYWIDVHLISGKSTSLATEAGATVDELNHRAQSFLGAGDFAIVGVTFYMFKGTFSSITNRNLD